jgi:hypothetical protein
MCNVALDSLSPLYVGRSLTAEHRTVTAAREGSTPFDPPKALPILIADCQLKAITIGPILGL